MHNYGKCLVHNLRLKVSKCMKVSQIPFVLFSFKDSSGIDGSSTGPQDPSGRRSQMYFHYTVASANE